jgi:hypothetical protein
LYVALVDDEDYESVVRYVWYRHSHEAQGKDLVYARRRLQVAPVRWQFMHTLITGYAQVDHEDHDGLNNQRYNLRDANNHLNQLNRRSDRDGASRFKGVGRRGSRWIAQVNDGTRGQWHNFGVFDNEEEAARAYDLGVVEVYGDFVATNVSLGLLPPS